jgi:hypothetical protein
LPVFGSVAKQAVFHGHWTPHCNNMKAPPQYAYFAGSRCPLKAMPQNWAMSRYFSLSRPAEGEIPADTLYMDDGTGGNAGGRVSYRINGAEYRNIYGGTAGIYRKNPPGIVQRPHGGEGKSKNEK